MGKGADSAPAIFVAAAAAAPAAAIKVRRLAADVNSFIVSHSLKVRHAADYRRSVPAIPSVSVSHPLFRFCEPQHEAFPDPRPHPRVVSPRDIAPGHLRDRGASLPSSSSNPAVRPATEGTP